MPGCRVERQLDQPREKVFGRKSNPSTPNIPVLPEATSLIPTSELLPAKPASVNHEASPGVPVSVSFAANKENSDHDYSKWTAFEAMGTPKDMPIPPVTPANQLHRPGYKADFSVRPWGQLACSLQGLILAC